MNSTRLPPVRVERRTPSGFAKFQAPWVPFPDGVAIIKAMARLIERPDEGRPMNLAVIAESGFGKSHLLDHFADLYPDQVGQVPARLQVVLFSVTSQCDGRALLRGLLSAIGASFKANDPYDELLRDFTIKASVAEVGLVVLDEFHNGICSRRDKTISMITAVRDVSNYLRRPIVVGGDTRVKELLRYDKQLMERFEVRELPVWSEKESIKRFLAAFELTLDMPEPSRLGTDSVADLVVSLAGDHMGSIAELVRESGKVAQKVGAKSIAPVHIKKARELTQRGIPA